MERSLLASHVATPCAAEQWLDKDQIMSEVADVPRIIDNTAENRFETTVDGHRAVLAYERDGRRLVLVHTEVPDELGGRGIGGRLVEAAAETAVVGHLTIVPRCPFASAWLRQHPEAADREAIDWPGA